MYFLQKKLQVIEMPGAASTHYSLPVNFKFLISLSLMEKFSQIHAKTLRNYESYNFAKTLVTLQVTTITSIRD